MEQEDQRITYVQVVTFFTPIHRICHPARHCKCLFLKLGSKQLCRGGGYRCGRLNAFGQLSHRSKSVPLRLEAFKNPNGTQCKLSTFLSLHCPTHSSGDRCMSKVTDSWDVMMLPFCYVNMHFNCRFFAKIVLWVRIALEYLAKDEIIRLAITTGSAVIQ